MRVNRGIEDNVRLVQRMLKEIFDLMVEKEEDDKDGKKKSKDKITVRDYYAPSRMQDPAEIEMRRLRPNGQEELIRLSDLMKKLDELNSRQPGGENWPAQQTDAAAEPAQGEVTQEALVIEHTQTEISIEIGMGERVEGLVLHSPRLAETDRYRLEFMSGSDFKITDKWSRKSTTIWGDPHVDTSDEQGAYNGDFKDLTGSSTHTTFMLEDGTRVTFTAQDAGIIEMVDIFKGSQHLHGTGAASRDWSAERMLFDGEVLNGVMPATSVPMGDVVYAGGDGNDWYDASGKLVWGKTTTVEPVSPSAWIRMEISQSMEQAVITSQTLRQA